MPMISFNSRHPNDTAADTDHGEIGRRYEALINSPAYLDTSHRDHMRTVDDASALAIVIYGDKSVNGGQPFAGSVIKTGPMNENPLAENPWDPYNLGIPTVGDGKGTPDEHAFPDHRPLAK